MFFRTNAITAITIILIFAIHAGGCTHFSASGKQDARVANEQHAVEPGLQATVATAGDESGAIARTETTDAPETTGAEALSVNAPAEGMAIDPVDTAGLPEEAAPDSAQGTQQDLDQALELCESAQEFWQKGELESALDALDRAYALILAIDGDSDDKLIQQKEDLRFLISKRILEIYASRNIVVSGNHNAIPRDINGNIQKEIDLFTKGPERNFFIAAYRRSGKYRPMILKKLAAAGMPEELSWLPLIESGFKVQALSRARALGLWQFIPSTGYKFGLRRNEYIDERIDFEKATDAAIAYLKELHGMFGDWSTVLAAYNCGEGRVLHVIRTQNINYLDDFWDLYGRLPYETARYVPRFLAALHVIENREKYGMADVSPDPPLAFERVPVSRQVHLKDLAAVLGSPLDDLKDLNPELRYQVLPAEKYTLRVPVGKRASLLAAIDAVPRSTPPRPAYGYHRVRSGETLSTIARRYRTSVQKLMWANNLRRSGYIVVGQRLKIPQRGMVVAQSTNAAAPDETTAWNGRHVVKRGDSLWILANKYKTTTKKIQEVNRLRSTILSINQVLRVPTGDSASARSTGGSGTYYVKRGESPYLIARKHNMSLNHFLQLNNLTSQSTIYPGQRVRVD